MQALHDKTGWMSNQKFFQCKLTRRTMLMCQVMMLQWNGVRSLRVKLQWGPWMRSNWMSTVRCLELQTVWQHWVLDVHSTAFRVHGRNRSVFSAWWIMQRRWNWKWWFQFQGRLRDNKGDTLWPRPEVPTEFEQAQPRLTHLPYQPWCPACVSHKARADRHENTGESHAGPVPTISFGFFYTKSDERLWKP